MTRLELGYVPAKVIQCEVCGRVKDGAGEWVSDPTVPVDMVVPFCATCYVAWQLKRKRDDWQRANRIRRRIAKGFGPAPEGADPFAGFREEGVVGTGRLDAIGPAPSVVPQTQTQKEK